MLWFIHAGAQSATQSTIGLSHHYNLFHIMNETQWKSERRFRWGFEPTTFRLGPRIHWLQVNSLCFIESFKDTIIMKEQTIEKILILKKRRRGIWTVNSQVHRLRLDHLSWQSCVFYSDRNFLSMLISPLHTTKVRFLGTTYGWCLKWKIQLGTITISLTTTHAD